MSTVTGSLVEAGRRPEARSAAGQRGRLLAAPGHRGGAAADDHRHHVGGLVDVPGQVGPVEDLHGKPQPFGLGPVAGEGARTVGEPEPGVGRQGDDVGAVAVAVGDQGDPRRLAHQGQIASPGEVGVGHGDLGDTVGHQMVDAGLDGTVEAPSRLPHHQRPEGAGPLGHVGVVADHGHRQRMGGPNHPVGHGPGQVGPLRSAHGQVQPPLGLIEGLDRDEHGPGSEGGRGSRAR